jgi:hypothetical protein
MSGSDDRQKQQEVGASQRGLARRRASRLSASGDQGDDRKTETAAEIQERGEHQWAGSGKQ